jgi:hypothetical protein
LVHLTEQFPTLAVPQVGPDLTAADGGGLETAAAADHTSRSGIHHQNLATPLPSPLRRRTPEPSCVDETFQREGKSMRKAIRTASLGLVISPRYARQPHQGACPQHLLELGFGPAAATARPLRSPCAPGHSAHPATVLGCGSASWRLAAGMTHDRLSEISTSGGLSRDHAPALPWGRTCRFRPTPRGSVDEPAATEIGLYAREQGRRLRDLAPRRGGRGLA